MIQTPTLPPIPPVAMPGSDMPSAWFIIGVTLASLPIVAVMVWGAVRIFGPIGQALARRIAGGTEGDHLAELADLRQQVDELRFQMGEMQERLDFTERLLAQQRDAHRLAGPA